MESLIFNVEEVIQESIATGRAIFLQVKNREGFVSAVDDFINKGDLKLIRVKPITLYGHRIDDTVFHLKEVEKIYPLSVTYHDPLYSRIRAIRQRVEKL